MRIFFPSDKRPRQIAKAIQRELTVHLGSCQLKLAQQITAKIYGYDSWRELLTHCGANERSKSDSDCDATTQADRRKQQIAAFGELVSNVVAAAIVDKIKPTGVRDVNPEALRSTVEDWRARLVSQRNVHGFFGTYGEHGRRLVKSDEAERHAIEGGLELVYARGNNRSEDGPIRIYDIEAILEDADGKEVAGVYGVLLNPSRKYSYSDANLFEALDSYDEASKGNALIEQTSIDLNDGPIFVLLDWITRSGTTSGLGMKLLDSLLQRIRKSFRGTHQIAFDLTPSQFGDITERKRLVNRSYRSARTNLRRYWWNVVRPSVASDWDHFEYEEKPYDGQGEFLEDWGRRLGTPRTLPEGMIATNEFNDVRNFLGKEGVYDDGDRIFVQRGGIAGLTERFKHTLTLPGEAKPLGRFDYPKGWSGMIWQVAYFFDPHPDFWRFLPSELDEVSIAMGRATIGCNALALAFRFSNGSELKISLSDLMRPETFPLMLRNALGGSAIINPYTDRLSSFDLTAVLRNNVGLLFSTRPNTQTFDGTTITLKREGSTSFSQTDREEWPEINDYQFEQSLERSLITPPSDFLSYAPNRFHIWYIGPTLGVAQMPPDTDHFRYIPQRFNAVQLAGLDRDHRSNMVAVEVMSKSFGLGGWKLIDAQAIVANPYIDQKSPQPHKRSRAVDGMLYISFGEHKFPTPHEDTWIDGFYVEGATNVPRPGSSLYFTSTSNPQLFAAGGRDNYTLYQDITKGFCYILIDGFTVESVLPVAKMTLPPNWWPFIEAPLRAANLCLNAISAHQTTSVRSSGKRRLITDVGLDDYEAVLHWMKNEAPIDFIAIK
jgi:hypothetical protein